MKLLKIEDFKKDESVFESGAVVIFDEKLLLLYMFKQMLDHQ